MSDRVSSRVLVFNLGVNRSDPLVFCVVTKVSKGWSKPSPSTHSLLALWCHTYVHKLTLLYLTWFVVMCLLVLCLKNCYEDDPQLCAYVVPNFIRVEPYRALWQPDPASVIFILHTISMYCIPLAPSNLDINWRGNNFSKGKLGLVLRVYKWYKSKTINDNVV